MVKKLLALLIIICFLFVPFGCSSEADIIKFDFKVGIITASEAYCPDEYSVVENLSALYGSDRIVSAAYSDDFAILPMVIKTLATSMVEDESVKVVIFDRAVVGIADAITAIKQSRDDIFIVCIASDEEASEISKLADLTINVDELKLGEDAVKQAAAMGAEVFIHYTYNRQLEYTEVVRRKEVMEKACKKAGIKFVNEASVDPSGGNGVDGAQQYIREDAVRKQEKYAGKKIAYFSTDPIIQKSLVETSLKYKTILPVQVNPSPYEGYPEILEIDITGHEFDTEYLLTQIKTKTAEKNNAGNMATWSVSMPQVMLNSAFTYAVKHVKKGWGDTINSEELIKIINEKAGGEGIVATKNYVDSSKKTYSNIFALSGETYNF